MRIARVRADGHDRRVIEFQRLLLHQPHEVLLRVEFSPVDPAGQAVSDRREQAVLAPLEGLGRPLVTGDVRRIPRGHHGCQCVGRREHLDAQCAHDLERAAVDAAHVGDGVARRVLHQHATYAAEHCGQRLDHLLAPTVRLHVDAQS